MNLCALSQARNQTRRSNLAGCQALAIAALTSILLVGATTAAAENSNAVSADKTVFDKTVSDNNTNGRKSSQPTWANSWENAAAIAENHYETPRLPGALSAWYPVETYDIWRIEPEATLLEFCEDEQGNIYFAGNTGIIRFDGGRWERITNENCRSVIALGDQILAVDNQGLKKITYRYGQTTVEDLNEQVIAMGLKRPNTLLPSGRIGKYTFLTTTHYIYRWHLDDRNELQWFRWYRGECLPKQWKFRRVVGIQDRVLVQLEDMKNPRLTTFGWLNDNGTAEILPAPVREDGSPFLEHVTHVVPLAEATPESPVFYAITPHKVFLIRDGIAYHKTPPQFSNTGVYISDAYLLPDQQLLLGIRPIGLVLLSLSGDLSELHFRSRSESGFQEVGVDSHNRIWAFGNMAIDRIDYGADNRYWRLPQSDNVSNVCQFNGQLFVSSQAGIFVAPIIKTDSTPVLGSFRRVLTSNMSVFLRRQHGNLYALSSQGLYLWVQTPDVPEGKWAMLSDIHCRDLTIDKQGRYFVATWDKGVVQMRVVEDAGDGSEDSVDQLELVRTYDTSELCRLLCCDSHGDLWMNALSSQFPAFQIQRISAETGEVTRYTEDLLPMVFGEEVLFTSFSPLLNASRQPDGFETEEQLYRFDRESQKIVPAVDVANSLISHGIRAGQAFATNQDWQQPRFYVFGGHESIAEVSQSGSQLTIRSARVSPGQKVARRVTSDDDGNVWIAINNKVWRATLTEHSEVADPTAPIQITRVELVNPETTVAQDASDRAPQLLIPHDNPAGPTVTLPYTVGTLRVSFSVPGFSMPERVLYRSRMVNLNNQWSNSEYVTQRDFAALSPGNYRFEVTAQFPGNLESEPSLINLIVLPPWYQTKSFYAACGFLILSAVGWLYRNKTRQVRVLRSEVDARMEIESRLRASQKELIQQERIRNLGEIAAGVAHDINNSLSPIMVYSELLQLESISDEAKSFCKHIDEGAADIALLLKRIQPMYRTNTSLVKSLDLPAILQQTVKSMREQLLKSNKKHAISLQLMVESSGGLPLTVNCQAADIREIVWNLLNNAVDAVGDGGRILVTCRRDEKFAQLEVKDDGIGMEPEVMERCFDTFYSTKCERGSGLGLSTTRSVVESYGGSIHVVSCSGQGTTFSIKFPLGGERASPQRSGSPKQVVNRPMRILVVDDIEATLASLRLALEHLDHHVVGASSGHQALNLLETKDFDIVITDHQMPDITGFELCRHLHLTKPDLATILITGYEESGMREVCDAFLGKPISMQSIARTIQESLLKRQARLGLRDSAAIADSPI